MEVYELRATWMKPVKHHVSNPYYDPIICGGSAFQIQIWMPLCAEKQAQAAMYILKYCHPVHRQKAVHGLQMSTC